MKIITIISEKGGVMKTGLALTLGCGLAARGHRVLIVDCDEQGHVATGLGLQSEPGLFELLQRNKSWAEVARPVPPERFTPPGNALMSATGSLLIVPSNEETGALRAILRPDAFQLRKRLQQLEGVIDYVLIDSPPSGTMMHLIIYTATDYALYPTKTEFLSFDGLIKAGTHLADANMLRKGWGLPPVEIIGIVPVMYRSAATEHKQNLADLRKEAGDTVWNPIAERIVWAEAFSPVSNYTPVYSHAPGTAAARDAYYLVNKLFETTGGETHVQSA